MSPIPFVPLSHRVFEGLTEGKKDVIGLSQRDSQCKKVSHRPLITSFRPLSLWGVGQRGWRRKGQPREVQRLASQAWLT